MRRARKTVRSRKPKPQPVHPDVRISQIAAPQHGIVSRAQLLSAGLSSRAIDRRIASGKLVIVRRGVYRVGPIAGPLAAEMAAVMACGDGALLSHLSAAAAWQIITRESARPIDVIVPGTICRRIAGITAHRVRMMNPGEIGCKDGVPITSPARTLLDIANVLGASALERAVATAERLGIVAIADMNALLKARPRHRGVRAMRAVIGEGSPTFTRSDAEAKFLALVRTAGLRTPRVNAHIGQYEVDFLWTAERLVVEVDGYAYHSSRAAFERDRRRDATLMKAGYRVLRFTWDDVVRSAILTMATVGHELGRAAGAAGTEAKG